LKIQKIQKSTAPTVQNIPVYSGIEKIAKKKNLLPMTIENGPTLRRTNWRVVVAPIQLG
jgi:hypothetical protein